MSQVNNYSFDETPVYNITQGDMGDMTWEYATEKFRALSYEYPFHKLLWYPNAHATRNKPLHKMKIFLYHMLPAYFIDALLVIFMQEPL